MTSIGKRTNVNKAESCKQSFCTNDSHRKDLEKTHKIPMLKEDFEFLESMKGDRKMCCEKNVDSGFVMRSKVDLQWFNF